MEKIILEKLGKTITKEEWEKLKTYYCTETDEEMIDKIETYNISINNIKINGKIYEAIVGDALSNETPEGPFYTIYLREDKRWATDEEERNAEF